MIEEKWNHVFNFLKKQKNRWYQETKLIGKKLPMKSGA